MFNLALSGFIDILPSVTSAIPVDLILTLNPERACQTPMNASFPFGMGWGLLQEREKE